MQPELKVLALDLLWSWRYEVQEFFRTLDERLWEETAHNPVVLCARLGEDGVAAALARPEVAAAFERAQASVRAYYDRAPAFRDARAPLVIGYFSLEFGIAECLPIYSGGLGILAGDHLKAASDLGLPLVGVGLLYRNGFGRQRIDEGGGQYELYPESLPSNLPVQRVTGAGGEPIDVEVPMGAGSIRAGIWRAQVGRVSLLLLDTDLDANPPEARTITDRLYVPEPDRRLRQEIVLGIGGVRALRAAGYEANVFHMNEGHGFLIAAERIRELRRRRQITLEEARLHARAGILFTTHTPVAAGSDYFEPGLVYDLLGPFLTEVGIPFERFMDLGRLHPSDPRERLCTTYVGLRMADNSVGVSRLHGAVSRRLWKDAWPGLAEASVPIGSVTNGVHMPSWLAPELVLLLESAVDPAWWDLGPDDARWAGLDSLSDRVLWELHLALKRRLIDAVRAIAGDDLDPEALTIGFSRRFAPYKRANLILGDRARLGRLLNSGERPVQIVFSGKAHPADGPGKAILRSVVEAARSEPRIAFVPDYDIEIARHLVHGADVWLNNPRRFLEASGTSGMKAGANGVLNCSVLDGWWDEGYSPDIGWAIPSGATLENPDADDATEADALYRLLERELIPSYYDRDGDGIPPRWVSMIRQSIRRVGTDFSARRMVLDYFEEAYAPAARRVQQLQLLPAWGG